MKLFFKSFKAIIADNTTKYYKAITPFITVLRKHFNSFYKPKQTTLVNIDDEADININPRGNSCWNCVSDLEDYVR